jgi:gas vesicle protein
MRFIIIVGGIVLSAMAAARLLRRKRTGPMKRARKEMRKAVSEVETTMAGLASRAKKLRGEAKETVEVQMRALESRREDLIERLQSAAEETKRSRKKAREAATAA